MRWFRKRLRIPSTEEIEREKEQRIRETEELFRRLDRIEAHLRVLRQWPAPDDIPEAK